MTQELTGAIGSLKGPQDFVMAIPRMLGFHPQDSLVAVVIRDGVIYLTMRCDSAALDGPDGPAWLAEKLGNCPTSGPPGRTLVFLAGYGPRDRASAMVRRCADQLGDAVLDAIVIENRQWWYVDDAGDSPGRRVPPLTGLPCLGPGPDPVAPSRDDLAARLAAPTGQREDELIGALMIGLDQTGEDNPVQAGRQVLGLIDNWRSGAELSDQDYLRCAAAMSVAGARDEIWKVTDAAMARDCLPFWQEVLSRTPQGVRLAVLGVTGLIAWIAGSGAVMNICLEEAESVDDEFPLVCLLRLIAQSSWPPDLWDEVVASADRG